MIRKPDARDFRESGTVLALRDAGAVAVEGARGVAQGTASYVGKGLLLLFGFGFVMAFLSALGPVASLLALGGGLAWFLSRRRARAARGNAAFLDAPITAHVRDATAVEAGRYELSPGAVGRAAARKAAPAVLIFPTAGTFSFMLPFTVAGVLGLTLAVLIMARLKGDRGVVRYDGRTLAVRGLFGEEATILWDDVGDVVVRKSSIFDIRTLFTSGSRRNIHVLGRRNRLGGPETLLIPIDLLGLTPDALARLAADFVALQAGAAPSSEIARPARPGASVDADMKAFDPDAIIARHLAEREALVAQQRPDLLPRPRATFGRKLA